MSRHQARVSTVSWIPSEAVTGGSKAIFATVAHYDDPPPDRIDGDDTESQTTTIDRWRERDLFRFANQLSAWIDVDDDGVIVDAGYDGECRIGSTTLGAGGKGVTFQAVALPVLRAEPERGDGWVRFVQSYGGRTGVPGPRRVNRPPFVQFWAPLVWTTLALTIYDDGSSEHEFVGCSPFPRHWLYDTTGELVAKSGTTNFKNWYRRVLPKATPWGDVESPALVTAVESAAERELSHLIMRAGRSPSVRAVKAGTTLMQQGAEGNDVFLVLDGVVTIDVDGEVVAELGPGAILGERAILEGGVRTSTVVATTECRLAVAEVADLDLGALRRVSETHRREHSPS
jgi:Cyclic nucleotide-binding domain